jgi:hypothetical protein
VTFQILTMNEKDAKLIENELVQIGGVRNVHTHLPTQSVTVTWASPATWDMIEHRLAELKYTPDYPNGGIPK